MTASIYAFPQRAPFAVRIEREAGAWLVVCRSHSWVHGSRSDAMRDAHQIARGFGVPVDTRSLWAASS